uniref:O-antigen translocase n=1 Tax=Prevotella sp. GTC17260 TaxID=3236796 RepID=A0AB33JKF5_9BACT
MKESKQTDSYAHILKYTGLFGSMQGLSILVGIIRTKLVALILGPDGVGLMSLFNSTIRLLGDTSQLGLPVSGVRKISYAYEHNDQESLAHHIKLLRSWGLVTGIVGMILCVALSPLLNSWTFNWGNHTLHFMLLAPIVALSTITGGELAILKGTRRLRPLALISLFQVALALIISVPLFLLWQQAAIIPSLLLVALSQMLLTIGYSYRYHPLRLSLQPDFLTQGNSTIRLGIAFMLAAMMGSGAEFIIRLFLNTRGNLDDVGLYNAGFMMTMTYAGMVFTALETDYFPRLSAIGNDTKQQNRLINRQIEVSLLLLAPMLIAFLAGMPIILPLLYSSKFLPALGMVQPAVLAMYLRALTLPLCYVPLARGDSSTYLIVEGLSAVAIIVAVGFGFTHWGLTGAGFGILMAGLADFFVLTSVAFRRYGYRMNRSNIGYTIFHFLLLLCTYAVATTTQDWTYWAAGFIFFLISAAFSWRILRQKTGDTSPTP